MTEILVRYFKIEEFDCQETGNNQMNEDFLNILDELRDRCNFPFKITSGYRDPTHPLELKKEKPGTHSQGIAADIRIMNGSQAYTLLSTAFNMGFGGIGIAKTFIHVDIRNTTPVVWTY